MAGYSLRSAMSEPSAQAMSSSWAELFVLVATAVGAVESSPAPSGDVSALPECLDGMPVVMLAHERDGPGAGYTI
jgi:hypothetical protein